MSIASFTNAVGSHYRRDIATARLSGIVDGSHRDEIISSTPYNAEFSGKPAAFYGDHKTPYNYWRTVMKVFKNEPFTIKRYDPSPHPIQVGMPTFDYTYEKYVTDEHEPFTYLGSAPDEGNARAESVVKALNRMADNKAAAGAAFGEGRQTVNQFADTAKKTASLLLAMKRGRWGDLPSILGVRKQDVASGRTRRNAANAWLAYKFGWEPLLADLTGLAKATMTVLESVYPVRGSSTVHFTGDAAFPFGSCDYVSTIRGSHRTHFLGMIRNKELRFLNSIGLTNPASVAWELVPWSFAIDWFVPVGQVLQACTAGFGLEDHGGYTTTHRTWSLTAHARVNMVNGTGVATPGHFHEGGFDFARFCYARFPTPQYFADTTPFSTARVANALALTYQLF